MDNALIEFGKQAPYVGMMVLLVLIFLNWIQKSEQTRAANAKQLDEERRQFEREINAMWANAVKSIVDQQEKSQAALVQLIRDHERASQERYDRLGKTDELIEEIRSHQGSRK